MAPAFNHQQIKRQAHGFARNDSQQTWNPFRLVTWNSMASPNSARRGTWNGPDVEAQRDGPVAGNGEKDNNNLSHAQTEPGKPTYADQADPPVAGSSSFTKDTEAPIDRTRSDSQHDGGGTGIDSQRSTFPLVNNGKDPKNNGSALRNRRRDEPQANSTGLTDDSVDRKKRDDAKKDEKSGVFRHVYPREPFTFANQLQRTLLNSWINILIIAAPVGIALNYVPSVNRVAIFVINFIAIVPLAAMLSFATEEIALRTGQTLGGLLNATFGNAVELIVAVMALKDGKTVIVQTSLIGSILSNLLLVMGCCFLFGGFNRPEQYFNTTVAQTAASLLALAVAAAIIPTVFDSQNDTPIDAVAKISRGTAVILLLVYGGYLFFQLKTHSAVFQEESTKVPAKPWSRGETRSGMVSQAMANPMSMFTYGVSNTEGQERIDDLVAHGVPRDQGGEEEFEDEPQLHFTVAVATLAISTIIIALCAEYMVDSIDAVTSSGGLSQEFVGLILLPIVGNAAEHATAVTVAIKDKMDLAIGVAVGSSMQVSLFLIPLLVVIGWGLGNDHMSLSFDVFQVAVLFVAVLLTNYLIADGKSHWLEGMLLICLYAIIAVCSFWYPTGAADDSNSSQGQ